MRAVEWAALLGLALLWGMSFMFMALALPSFSPFTLVLIRVGVAGALMVALVWGRAPWRFVCERWRIYAVLGFFGSGLPFVCYAWGQQYIESGLASVLNALTPMFTLMLAVGMGREKFDALRTCGLVAGFVGVAALMNPEASGSEWGGIAAATLAALCYAVAANYAWARAANFSPKENACGQLVFSTLFVLPFAVAEAPWLATPSALGVAAVLGLAVLSTFCAYLLYYFLVSHAGGVNAVLAVLLVPVVAVSLGIALLGERFGSEFFVGGGLILGGVVLTDAKLRALLGRLLRGGGGRPV